MQNILEERLQEESNIVLEHSVFQAIQDKARKRRDKLVCVCVCVGRFILVCFGGEGVGMCGFVWVCVELCRFVWVCVGSCV